MCISILDMYVSFILDELLSNFCTELLYVVIRGLVSFMQVKSSM